MAVIVSLSSLAVLIGWIWTGSTFLHNGTKLSYIIDLPWSSLTHYASDWRVDVHLDDQVGQSSSLTNRNTNII